MNTLIFEFKPQSRKLRTQDANQIDNDEDGSCPVEQADADSIDESFQLAIVGQGPATIRWVRPWAFTIPPDTNGDGTACEDEPGLNIVRFDGFGVNGTDLEEMTATLANIPFQHFEANKTVQINVDEFSAVGAGFAESVINQRAADRVANIIATQQAEMELLSVRPAFFSTGFGFE